MGSYATADELLSEDQLAERDLELPSGRFVQLRGLTTGEVRKVLRDGGDLEAGFVAAGLVQPSLTAEQAQTWAVRAPAGDFVATANRIKELSGVFDGAAKSSVPGDAG